MPFAHVNGIRLHYEETGSGPLVVLSSGGVEGRMLTWKTSTVFRQLAERHRVVVYDRRYGGESDAPIEVQSLETWAEDIRQLVLYLGEGSAYHVGSSQGAAIALALAVLYPEAVRGLVLEYPTGGKELEDTFFRLTWEGTAAYAEAKGMDAVIANPGGPWAMRVVWDDEFADRLRHLPVAEYAAIMRESARRLFKGYPTVGASEEQLRSLAVPVLVIPGDDSMHPRSVGETIASLVPDSRLIDLPHHGLVPQRFVREVSAFIDMCESRHVRQ